MMRIAIAQINTTVGALEANAEKISGYIAKARRKRCDIVVFPELALCGYPPEDLLFKKSFLKANSDQLRRIIKSTGPIFAIVGFPEYSKDGIFNSAALIYNKKLVGTCRKIFLPNKSIFDEKRYFLHGDTVPILPFGSVRVGVNICEDIWHPYGPHSIACREGKAKVIINISASPYHTGKIRERQNMLKERAVTEKAFICYCNSTGGQDELVFDGGSLVIGPDGSLITRVAQFKEGIAVVDLDTDHPKKSLGKIEKPLGELDEIYSALSLGLKDYVRKNGFRKVVLGLSGGIDSALTAKICCDALGRENVTAVSMPSKFTSDVTRKDTVRLAKNLGVGLITIPINDIYNSYLAGLKGAFRTKKHDITEENIQARIRGDLLMALSNKFKWLVVSTGNKSEISVGYCTLYGDMVGGFAVLKDVPKTLVYKLAEFVNKKDGFECIPASVIMRAPTAELRKDQKDCDTLPPYPVLDKILDAYIEKDKAKEAIIKSGLNRKTVDEVISMVDRNEYKRRQAPPGVRITPRAFGKDRRMPITNRLK